MSELSKAEVIERFDQGLREAASRCRELGKLQNKPVLWNQIATSLDTMRKNGELLIKQGQISQEDVLAGLSRYHESTKH